MSRWVGERLLGVATLAAGATAVWLGLVVAPPDAVQGQPQRLLYVHVPAAWVAYAAFAWVLVASVGYLARRDLRWDRHARAAAEVGVGLTGLAIALGSLWARPVWGVWWTWDARLVTTVVLLLSYVGYLGVRQVSADPHRAARQAAVVGILAFVNVPVVHFSVLWWRTLHQPPTVLQPGPAPMDPAMLAALVAGVVAFSLAALWVGGRRVHRLVPPVDDGTTRQPAAPIRVTAGGAR